MPNFNILNITGERVQVTIVPLHNSRLSNPGISDMFGFVSTLAWQFSFATTSSTDAIVVANAPFSEWITDDTTGYRIDRSISQGLIDLPLNQQ